MPDISESTNKQKAQLLPGWPTVLLGNLRGTIAVWCTTGRLAMEGLNNALVGVYSLLTVTIAMILFGCKAPCKLSC